MPEWQRERRGTAEDDGDDHHDGPGAPPGPPAPFPALINLTVPAGTAYGWSAAPGEAGGWGLTDPGDTRRLLQAASAHPRTRWCVTLLPRRHRRRPRLRPRPPPLDTRTRHWRRPRRTRRPPQHGPARHHKRPGWLGRAGHNSRRRAGCPAGRRARRLPAETERHAHPHRQRDLRPCRPGRPLHPQQETQAPGPDPHRAVHRTRLRRPGRCTATSTTPSPTPPGSPASATWPPPVAATTDASKPPAGSSPSHSPASCAGRRPPGAATPPAHRLRAVTIPRGLTYRRERLRCRARVLAASDAAAAATTESSAASAGCSGTSARPGPSGRRCVVLGRAVRPLGGGCAARFARRSAWPE